MHEATHAINDWYGRALMGDAPASLPVLAVTSPNDVVAFVGDGSSNMARSFIEAARSFEFHLELCCPDGYRPPAFEVERAKEFVEIHADPAEALRDVAFVHTDVWTSMGQEAETERRKKAFAGFTLNSAMLGHAPQSALVMHCLPAHRGEEISESVLEGPRSIVWDQAENRLHTQKAIMLLLVRANQ